MQMLKKGQQLDRNNVFFRPLTRCCLATLTPTSTIHLTPALFACATVLYLLSELQCGGKKRVVNILLIEFQRCTPSTLYSCCDRCMGNSEMKHIKLIFLHLGAEAMHMMKSDNKVTYQQINSCSLLMPW